MTRRFVYVGTLDFNGYRRSFGIHTLLMNCESGELSLLESQNQGCNASFVVISSNGMNLYAISERLERGSVFTYKINPKSHYLSYVNKLVLPAAGCVHNTVSQDDQYVLISCWKTSNIISCRIGKDGVLESVVDNLHVPQGSSVKKRQTQPTPHQMVFDRSGKFALAPDLGSDRIYVIAFNNQTGKMTLKSIFNVDPGGGPRHLVFHPNNYWVYLITELDNAVYKFDFNEETGELIRRQKVNLLPEDFLESYNGPEIQGGEIQISPDGRFVFTSTRGYYTEEGYDRIFRLEIDQETGGLDNLSDFPAYGICPRMFDFTSDSRFMLVCNQSDNEVVSLSYEAATGNVGNVCGKVEIKEAAVLDMIEVAD